MKDFVPSGKSRLLLNYSLQKTRELWKKEIFIPTKGPTEISNSEWEY